MFYLIKVNYEATKKNTNHYGTEKAHETWVQGKNGSSEKYDVYMRNQKFYNSEYAYTTLHGANKGLKAVQSLCDLENEHGNWKVTCELIRV